MRKVIVSLAGVCLLRVASACMSIPNQAPDPGETLYKKFQCISCHGSKGTSPYNLTDARMEYTHDNLKRYISNPREFGNGKMPVFKGIISESEFKDLTGYVIRLQKDAQNKN
jgi:mono/diheme cytochrome c family protein